MDILDLGQLATNRNLQLTGTVKGFGWTKQFSCFFFSFQKASLPVNLHGNLCVCVCVCVCVCLVSSLLAEGKCRP